MKTVATFYSPVEAHLAAARLRGSGIEVFVRDEYTITFDWLTSNAIGGVKVQVDEDNWDFAHEILSAPCADTGIISCPHCQSADIHVRVLSFWGAVLLILKLPIPLKRATVGCRTCKRTHSIRIDGR